MATVLRGTAGGATVGGGGATCPFPGVVSFTASSGQCCHSPFDGRPWGPESLCHFPKDTQSLSAGARISPTPLRPGSCPWISVSPKESLQRLLPHKHTLLCLPPSGASSQAARPLARACGRSVCHAGWRDTMWQGGGLCICLWQSPRNLYVAPGMLQTFHV